MRFQHTPQNLPIKKPKGEVPTARPPQPGAKTPRFRNAAPKARPVLAEPPAALEVPNAGAIWEGWKLRCDALKMHLKIL